MAGDSVTTVVEIPIGSVTVETTENRATGVVETDESIDITIAPSPVVEEIESVDRVSVIEQGVVGPPGPPGPAGPAEDLVYRQDVPALVWTIMHGLNSHPSVTVIDSTGEQVWGDVRYPDTNTVQITFLAAFSGVARLI